MLLGFVLLLMDGSTVHFPARAPQKFRAYCLLFVVVVQKNEKVPEKNLPALLGASRFRFTETPLWGPFKGTPFLIRIPRPKRIFSTRLDIRSHRETRPLPLEVNEGPRSSDKDQLAVLSIFRNLGLYFIIPSNF